MVSIDVLVESREEPESMLAGQAMLDRSHGVAGELMPACAVAIIDHAKAACLATCNISAFEDDDLKAALDQLVRGTHPRHAAAEDDDPSRHVSPGDDGAHESYLVRLFFSGLCSAPLETF